MLPVEIKKASYINWTPWEAYGSRCNAIFWNLSAVLSSRCNPQSSSSTMSSSKVELPTSNTVKIPPLGKRPLPLSSNVDFNVENSHPDFVELTNCNSNIRNQNDASDEILSQIPPTLLTGSGAPVLYKCTDIHIHYHVHK